MNYKFLFPSYLNRFLFVKSSLERYQMHSQEEILHIGTGEGDYDPMLSSYCSQLIACDINKEDLEFAKKRNRYLPNVEYRIEDVVELSFDDNTFDKVIAVEVLEHVSDPQSMIRDIFRVLKPNGFAIITFPRLQFPFTYDPINRMLSWFSQKHFSIGAYAFGHHHLISSLDFRIWTQNCGFQIIHENTLSGSLVGLFEVYWSGIVHRMFKSNSSNQPVNNQTHTRRLRMRPGKKITRLSSITLKILELDSIISPQGSRSLGMGYVLQKTNTPTTSC